MNISLFAVLMKRLMAVCVVSLMIWHVTHFGTAPRGKAIVYAPRQNDVVMIDGQDYLVESVENPLVCDLESGKHILRVKRGNLTVAEEDFIIVPDENLVLTPHDRRLIVEPTTPTRVDREATSPTGLAIRAIRHRPTRD